MILKGKNVIITGTNRGIGKKMLEVFAREGANIWAHARKQTPNFIKLVDSISNEYGVSITPIYCDMTNKHEIKECVKQVMASKERVDVLINNVGVAHGGLFQMTSVDKIREIFEINLFSIMEFTQLISKLMLRQKSGSIVNMSSISGLDLKAGNSAYGTSKAALIAFTQTLSKELASAGIRVNAIAPGLTDTDMATLMEEKAGKAMIEGSAMQRLGKPEEIAELALFLASDKASFINGQVIRCDGGTK
jgi:3-oxoacyl-[acyl-carrier protein] reductase